MGSTASANVEGEEEVHPHKHGEGSLEVAVVTVSDTRDLGSDPSGDLIQERLEALGHSVERRLVRDEPEEIGDAVEASLDRDAVVTTGGTGVAPRDVTVETLRKLFDKELTGFSTVFTLRSYEEVGTRAVLSRATAGVVDSTPVFCLPGSRSAAETGVEILEQELFHVVNHAED